MINVIQIVIKKNVIKIINHQVILKQQCSQNKYKQPKQSIKRIYQDIKNQQIILVSIGQELNNEIKIIKPSQYILFGQFDSLKNKILAELFSISPISPSSHFMLGEQYKDLNLLIVNQNIQIDSPLDQILFNIINDFFISTQDQKINFWGLNNKNWELNSSFNMLPEKVHDLIFIEDGRILICKIKLKINMFDQGKQNMDNL